MFSQFLLVLFLNALSIFYTPHSDTLTEDISTIGVKQYIWVDHARWDEYYGGNRIINAQVWYPGVENKKSMRTPYYLFLDKAHPYLDNWSEEEFHFVQSIQTQSWLDIPVKTGTEKYPVIILSPSLGGNLSQYTFYAEYLARKGYIVLGINHLFESEFVINSHGHTIPTNQTFHDSLKTLNIPEQITADEYREVKGIRQKVLGEDIIFSLEQLFQEPFFEEILDTNRVGAFGHSIGGAAVIYASLLDDRIDVVADIDGTPPTVALTQGISVPFLFIEDLTDYNNHSGYAKLHARRNTFCERNHRESWRILMGGTSHNSFLDINYHLADTEYDKRQSWAVLKETANYLETFFSHHLSSKPLPWIEVHNDSLEILYFK